ncbi:MAG: hypothetical protein PF637_03815 [Spirochaetes bacterium]|jgi:hypothetical protein|nr:hypothetical protein [Spirochaetota bacterium]
MRTLILLMTFLLLFFSCTPQGALSHESAFLELQSAFQNRDVEGFESILSENSKPFILKLIKPLNNLSPEAKNRTAKKLNITPERLNLKTVPAYIELYFLLNETHQKESIALALERDIAKIRSNEQEARYTMGNGIALFFVKEERYWKFDFERSMNGS